MTFIEVPVSVLVALYGPTYMLSMTLLDGGSFSAMCTLPARAAGARQKSATTSSSPKSETRRVSLIECFPLVHPEVAVWEQIGSHHTSPRHMFTVSFGSSGNFVKNDNFCDRLQALATYTVFCFQQDRSTSEVAWVG